MSQPESFPWPYPVHYGKENEVDTDLLILGGGLAGPAAAITAAKKGLRVALVDKGCTLHSGSAGSGIDHWVGCPNPASPVSPEELTEAQIQNQGRYTNAISTYIRAKEGYDALLELESYGAKVRDINDLFKGAEFRDEKTKLLFARDYVNRIEIRIWGRTFKPALYRELKRCGVKLYERTMATSLLTEGGKQGARVIGATGFNIRTGEFYTFRAKATLLAMGHAGAHGWVFSGELQGLGSRHGPAINTGDGISMAWRAGAQLTMLEKSEVVRRHHAATEGSDNTSWFAVTVVDANGKDIPWFDRDGNELKTMSER
ncbi:MAG: FAD-dependent oxidoreductase, partial [Chloroflexi bacterium]|nr:FAD-dependent oxidoreductase [Chloroflexota bacterium]